MKFRRRAEEASILAAYAAVLDGRHLWLAVDETPGRLALRAGGRVVDLPAVADDQPGYLSVRLDLASLPTEAASYDVVVVAPDGVRPVSHPSLADRQVPVAPGGRARHVLRADDEALVLVTVALPPSLELDAVSSGPDGVRLSAGGEETVLADDGPARPWARVTVGDLPVRRRDHDLLEPGRAVPLPGAGRLRLRWSPEGLLQSRVVEEG